MKINKKRKKNMLNKAVEEDDNYILSKRTLLGA